MRPLQQRKSLRSWRRKSRLKEDRQPLCLEAVEKVLTGSLVITQSVSALRGRYRSLCRHVHHVTISPIYFSKGFRVKKLLLAMVTVAIVFAAATSRVHSDEKITQDELVRRTQELSDAVAPGNKEPWKKYFAD